jgi:hypothetical protein
MAIVTDKVIIISARICSFLESLEVYIRIVRRKILSVANNVNILNADILFI